MSYGMGLILYMLRAVRTALLVTMYTEIGLISHMIEFVARKVSPRYQTRQREPNLKVSIPSAKREILKSDPVRVTLFVHCW